MAEGAAAFVRFKDEGRYELTSTSTNCALNSTSFAPAGEEGRALARARSASSPASRKFSGLSRQHGRAPQHGEDRDIFERLYAVRLDRLRALEECRSLLAPLDHQGLLAGAETARRRACRDDGR